MRRRDIAALASALAFLCGTSNVKADPPAEGPPLHALAPEFALPAIDGRYVHLAQYRGHPVVLNFCAFWCDTWKAEWPYLQELSDERKDLGFTLLSISVDATRVSEFRTHGSTQPPFPMLLDIGSGVTETYRIRHVPTVVILDGEGNVVYVSTGYPGNALIEHFLRRMAG